MNIFNLAYLELEREGNLNKGNEFNLLLDRAIRIRKWLDLQIRNKLNSQKRWKKYKNTNCQKCILVK